jgi:RNA polymerase sigma-70 factor, ECF subfamily
MTSVEFNHKLLSLESKMESFAMILTSNREKAKDLLQETYLKALTHKDKYVEVENFKAWTYTIMKNTFINNYRKSCRENISFDYTKDIYLLSNLEESSLGRPDSEVAYKEINKAIDKLDDEFKIPFRMHIEGYKYIEIAKALNLKIGTVKSRIFLFRKKLMELIHEYK